MSSAQGARHRATYRAATRSTAARQVLASCTTCDKNAQSVTTGVNSACGAVPKVTPSAAKARSTASADRTLANGKPSALRNGAKASANCGQREEEAYDHIEASLDQIDLAKPAPRKASRKLL